MVAKVLAKLGVEEGEDNTVHRIIMNPKALTINQMYGHFDELNEWNDGIIATTYRQGKTLKVRHKHVISGTSPTYLPKNGSG